MKPFNDFYQSSKEGIDNLIEKAILNEFSSKEKLTTEELVAAVVNLNRNATLGILKTYHDWLSEQIDQHQ